MTHERTPRITRRAAVRGGAAAALTALTALAAACQAGTPPTTSPVAVPRPPGSPPGSPRVVATSPVTPPVTPPVASPVTPGPPAPLELHVDNSHPDAADTNAGTPALPLRTVARAAVLAGEGHARGEDVRVVVGPGVYRETVRLTGSGVGGDGSITFEAREGGTAIISGSDVWGNWRKGRRGEVYSHPWPYTWGLAPYPPGWQGNVELAPIVRRREMIFMNGVPLTQVLSQAEMEPGTFYVAEEVATVYLSPPPGVAVEGGTVEVAVRAGIFRGARVHNLRVRGLTFSHDGSPLDGTAAAFDDCTELRVEECQFRHNNWTGFGVHTSQGVVVRGNVANENGAIGMEAYQSKNLWYEANETSYNNWRGVRGDFITWATGGLKHLLVHGGVYRAHRSVGNHACGCWFDTDCREIVVDDLYTGHNEGEGLFIEALQGPVTVTRGTICHNGGPGIYTEGATQVTVQGAIIYGNGDAQIKALRGPRAVTDWETQAKQNEPSSHWTLAHNVIVSTNDTQNLIDAANSEAFVGTLTANDNLWYSPGKSRGFVIEHRGVSFERWRAVTGQDGRSLLADPRFVNPDHDDFTPRFDSPLRNTSPP